MQCTLAILIVLSLQAQPIGAKSAQELENSLDEISKNGIGIVPPLESLLRPQDTKTQDPELTRLAYRHQLLEALASLIGIEEQHANKSKLLTEYQLKTLTSLKKKGTTLTTNAFSDQAFDREKVTTFLQEVRQFKKNLESDKIHLTLEGSCDTDHLQSLNQRIVNNENGVVALMSWKENTTFWMLLVGVVGGLALLLIGFITVWKVAKKKASP